MRGSQAQTQTDDDWQSQVVSGTQSQVPMSQLSGIIRKPQPKPTLKAHVGERHAGEPSKFKMEVVQMHRGDALLGEMLFYGRSVRLFKFVRPEGR